MVPLTARDSQTTRNEMFHLKSEQQRRTMLRLSDAWSELTQRHGPSSISRNASSGSLIAAIARENYSQKQICPVIDSPKSLLTNRWKRVSGSQIRRLPIPSISDTAKTRQLFN